MTRLSSGLQYLGREKKRALGCRSEGKDSPQKKKTVDKIVEPSAIWCEQAQIKKTEGERGFLQEGGIEEKKSVIGGRAPGVLRMEGKKSFRIRLEHSEVCLSPNS